MHFVAALDQGGMRAVLVLFEGVATGAADGYARMAEKPTASLLHLGRARQWSCQFTQCQKSPIAGRQYHRRPCNLSPTTGSAAHLRCGSPRCRNGSNRPNGAEVGHDAAAAVRAAPNGGQVASLILPADTAWTPAHDYGVYRKPQSPSAACSRH